MEMSGEQLATRMLSSIGHVDSNNLRTGRVKEGDWPRVIAASKMLSETNVYVDDSTGLSPLELRARARRLWRKSGNKLGLIIVDYLQLMESAGDNETEPQKLLALRAR